MGAISETLFESELFGHVKGAFTDARENRAGRFEIAQGGTLFLDEIGNLPLASQAKLLAVLENRQVTPVGSNSPRPIDIRLISATNQPIQRRVAAEEFRQDLLYRINTVEIHLPALRERGEDLPKLAEHFLHKFTHKYNKSIDRIDKEALKHLGTYSWPGNVRELQHALERAVIMSNSTTLRWEDLGLSLSGMVGSDLKSGDCNLEQVEKTTILKALDKNRGNVSRAAQDLGLTRASLYRRLHKYGL
jgi:transcriptional regulator with PAS, ATPase and Fis domain